MKPKLNAAEKRIVAWLRSKHRGPMLGVTPGAVADAIERGEHREPC